MDPALTQVHGVDGEGHFSEARIWVGDRDLAEDSNLFRTAEVLVQLFSALGEPFTNQNLLPPRAQVEYMLAEQVKLGRESVNIFVELVAQTGSVCLGKRILSGMANFLVCMLQIRNQAPHAALSEPPLVVWDADNLVASLLLLALISGGAADTHLHGLEDAQRSWAYTDPETGHQYNLGYFHLAARVAKEATDTNALAHIVTQFRVLRSRAVLLVSKDKSFRVFERLLTSMFGTARRDPPSANLLARLQSIFGPELADDIVHALLVDADADDAEGIESGAERQGSP